MHVGLALPGMLIYADTGCLCIAPMKFYFIFQHSLAVPDKNYSFITCKSEKYAKEVALTRYS